LDTRRTTRRTAAATPEPRRMVPVPAFAAPPDLDEPLPWATPGPQLPTTENTTTIRETAADADRDDLVATANPATIRGERVGYDSPEEPRTGNSSGSEPLASINAGKVLGTIIRIVARVAGRILINAGRQLRQPTRDQADAFAAPVARILVRHLPAAKVPADLVDLAAAGEAVDAYLADGPVTARAHPAVVHVGMVPPDVPDDPAPVTPAAPSPAAVWTDDVDTGVTAAVPGPRTYLD